MCFHYYSFDSMNISEMSKYSIFFMDDDWWYMKEIIKWVRKGGGVLVYWERMEQSLGHLSCLMSYVRCTRLQQGFRRCLIVEYDVWLLSFRCFGLPNILFSIMFRVKASIKYTAQVRVWKEKGRIRKTFKIKSHLFDSYMIYLFSRLIYNLKLLKFESGF